MPKSDYYNPHIPSHKTTGMTPAMKKKLDAHAEHHTKKHMDKMISLMKKGHSFSKSHTEAMKSDPPTKRKETSTIKIGDSKITMEKGRLHRDLNIPMDKKIPMSLINRLAAVENGEMFAYQGKQKKMTPALKKRVVLARTLIGFKKK